MTETTLDEDRHGWTHDGEWLVFGSRDAKTGRCDVTLMNYRTKAITKPTGAGSMRYHQAPVFVE